MNEPLLAELRERFRETSRTRLAEMAPLLDAPDADAIRRLARHFHAFSGLGATYGFPRVSDLGDEGESLILGLVRLNAEATPEIVARLRELGDEIARALEEGDPIHVATATAGARRRILAVEDDETHGLLLTHILSTAGYDVRVCHDPRQCEQTLAEFTPDLLLTDIQLADDERGGYNLVRRMRADARFQSLPVIFVSGDHALDSIEGDPLITKPVDWTRLLSLIESRLC